MGAGAPRSGVYHYSGIGEVNAYSLWRPYWPTLPVSALRRCPELMELVTVEDEPATSLSLDCAAIRHQFGIQQLSWQEFVPRAVRRYIDLYSET